MLCKIYEKRGQTPVPVPVSNGYISAASHTGHGPAMRVAPLTDVAAIWRFFGPRNNSQVNFEWFVSFRLKHFVNGLKLFDLKLTEFREANCVAAALQDMSLLYQT